MAKTIVVLQRGWVVVGDLWESQTGIKLDNASVIRRWGTTKGLGQLALEGPQAETQLEPCGTVEARHEAVIFRLPCTGWS